MSDTCSLEFQPPIEADKQWMQAAIAQARLAFAADEVPVGAVLVADGHIVGAGYNQVITLSDPSAHAEIQALRVAGQARRNYRLLETTLYVTLEPCVMCVGALIQARVYRLVYGASEPKTGAVCSIHRMLHHPAHNHTIVCTQGVLADSCAQLLTDFFAQKRQK